VKQTSTAQVAGLGTADAPGTFVTRAVPELTLTFGGIEGDRHFGLTVPAGVRETHQPRGAELKNARQLSLVSVEELAEIARTLGVQQVEWQRLGANLCLEGRAALSKLSPSSRLVFPSGATVVVDSENAPCGKPARELQQPHFVKAALGRRGLVGWVERAGVVRVGDLVTIWEHIPKP
jgi:MOSC domain-containing protein YiiM